MGLIAGVSAGPVMSLPALALPPEQRAIGMGIFSTVFYVFVLSMPSLAGAVADAIGQTGATFHTGAALCALCLILLPVFHRLLARA